MTDTNPDLISYTAKKFLSLEVLSVKTQKPEITFLADFTNIKLIKNHTWYSSKEGNTYYIYSKIKNKTTKFHQLIFQNWRFTDNINRFELDNCYNVIDFDKTYNHWRFKWYKNRKQKKTKYFKLKQQAINFKKEYNKLIGNLNGKEVKY
ncbi:hypothetical protein C2G38_2187875 [Gigaspora rosea]|uniref:Uncharacterized protein n=1 Tax=Gigaspora rosea TaxID=44941 RepID=A0A397VB78_9GLOM|nr:hypothetical protein C2G38_2187875 [Gigaspora rosea]